MSLLLHGLQRLILNYYIITTTNYRKRKIINFEKSSKIIIIIKNVSRTILLVC